MKNILLLVLSTVFVAACHPMARTSVTVESMEDFIGHFEQELQALGTFTQPGRGGGHSGRATSYRITFRGPPDADIDKIFSTGMAALNSWGRELSYQSRGRGGGGNVFSMHYGDQRSRGFFDAVGYETNHGTVVTVFWKVVE